LVVERNDLGCAKGAGIDAKLVNESVPALV